MPTVLKSGSLNLLEPSGLVQACNGIALLLPLHLLYDRILDFLTTRASTEKLFEIYLMYYGIMVFLSSHFAIETYVLSVSVP